MPRRLLVRMPRKHRATLGHGLLALALLLGTPEVCAQDPSPATPQAQPAPAAAIGGFSLQDGSPVQLALCGPISSYHARLGDLVDFQVTKEVTLQDMTVIPLHSYAWGKVIQAHAGRGASSRGKLGISVEAVRLANGEEVLLRAVQDAEGAKQGSKGTQVAAGAALAFLTVGLALPFLLFSRGSEVTIDDGTPVTAFVNGAVPLDPEKFGRTSAARPEGTSGKEAPAARLFVTASRRCGQIEIDGSYVALTPFESAVSPGEHSLAVRKKGFKTFEMRLEVPPGSLHIEAQLEPEQKAGAKPVVSNRKS